MRRRAIPLVAAAALFFIASQAALVSQGDYPELYLYVNDFSNVLLKSEADNLDEICYQLDQLTSDEIAIVTVNDTLPDGIDLYAVNLFQSSGIGKAGKDNGVLMLVATGEGRWRIEVGYGLEGILNDAKVGTIGRTNLEPYINAGDYYAGLLHSLARIVENLTADPSRYQEKSDPGIWGLCVLNWMTCGVPLAIFIVVAIITRGRVFLWVGSIASRGRFGGGRSGGGGAKGRF